MMLTDRFVTQLDSDTIRKKMLPMMGLEPTGDCDVDPGIFIIKGITL